MEDTNKGTVPPESEEKEKSPRREASFKVTRAPQVRYGFYAVTKGDKHLDSVPSERRRFVAAEDWTGDERQRAVTESQWDAMLAPQDFANTRAFREALRQLPDEINRQLWKQGIFALPMLADHPKALEGVVAEFRRLLIEAAQSG